MDSKPPVLIVEDEPGLRHLLRLTLSQDFEVDEARDGEEALRRVAERPYPLILLDVMLPGMDGYSICDVIRQMPNGQGAKIVFCTGRGGIAGRARGRECGAEAYIVKPFSPTALLAQLKAILAAPPADETACPQPS